MVQLRLLGGAILERGGLPIPGRPAQRHPLAMLALLAAAPGGAASRDRLIAYLWPDAGAARGRHRLSVALHVLRRALEPGVIENRSDSLVLAGPDCIRSDVRDFRDALADGRLEDAVRGYGGPFLDGFFLTGAPEFERWVDAERDRLAALYTGAVERLAAEAQDRGDTAGAVAWWRRLAAHEPLAGQATLGLMRALRDADDRAAALAHARAHMARVRGELDVPPDPAVEELAAGIAAELQATTRAAHPVPAPPARGPAPTARASVPDPAQAPEPAHRLPARPLHRAAGAAALALTLAVVAVAVRARPDPAAPAADAHTGVVRIEPFSGGDPGERLAAAVAEMLAWIPDLRVETAAAAGAATGVARVPTVAGHVAVAGDRATVAVRLLEPDRPNRRGPAFSSVARPTPTGSSRRPPSKWPTRSGSAWHPTSRRPTPRASGRTTGSSRACSHTGG